MKQGILGMVMAVAIAATLPVGGFAGPVKPVAKTPASQAASKKSAPTTVYSAKSVVKTSAAKTPAEKPALAVPLPNPDDTSAVSPDSSASGDSTITHVDFLRTIPLEVSGYEAGKNMPSHFTTAEEVMQVITSTPVMLVHMEALRRGYHDLSAAEQEKLLAALHKRRMTNENDLALGFDHGYAQLVYKENKTGLFFLRKANDKFHSQFTNLAYGMAQVEADINLEGAKPEETTTRKMDATYDLADAVKIDALKHQPGFWPSYIKVIEKMKPLPAYKSFTRRDFSKEYVPYGSKVVPLAGSTTSSLSITASDPAGGVVGNALTGSATTTCNPSDAASTLDAALPSRNAIAQRGANFNGNTALIQFFPTEQTHVYRVQVTDSSGAPMLHFKTYDMPNIVEDIDSDGVLEIVARQYAYSPEHPVLVYRYTPCGFELDQKIHDDFE